MELILPSFYTNYTAAFKNIFTLRNLSHLIRFNTIKQCMHYI